MRVAVSAAALFAFTANLSAADLQHVSYEAQPGQISVVIGKTAVASYIFNDPSIKRPYFAHVKTPRGVQVTRNHPPHAGQDVDDHPTYHPGIWLAFGDISGRDYWRMKARVKHVEFAKPPVDGPSHGCFAVRNQYLDPGDAGAVVCEEHAEFKIVVRPTGYLIVWDSEFFSDTEFYFGDQEEMGLGFRVATPIRVEQDSDDGVGPGNGTIRDAEGRKNGEEVWGKTADWCDYSGTIEGQLVGITIFCHPENFRPSWFHARDYGLLLANPFGRAAFTNGTESKVVVKPPEKLRLRYGLLVHGSSPDDPPDLAAEFAAYLRMTGR